MASLLPTDVRHWWPIIEEVFTSPAVASLTVKLLTTFPDLRESQVISVDTAIKCCMGVLGQLSYRAPKAQRDAAPFADDHAFRRILTVRGRTGAALGMQWHQKKLRMSAYGPFGNASGRWAWSSAVPVIGLRPRSSFMPSALCPIYNVWHLTLSISVSSTSS